MIARDLALIALNSASDLSGKEGYFIKVAGDGVSVTAVTAAATDVPLGVVSAEAAAGANAGILIGGAFQGTTRVKLSPTPGAVILGSYLVITADGSVRLDPGSGARVQVARAVESGVANERVEAVLLPPVVFLT